MKRLLSLLLCCAVLLAASSAFATAPTPDASGVLTFSGSGTSIVEGVAVTQVPARVTVTGTVQLTLSGKYDFTYNTTPDASDCGTLTNADTYEALVEGTGDWSVTIEPLKDGGAITCEGEGSYVSDFFPLDKSTIVTITFDTSTLADLVMANGIINLNSTGKYGLPDADNLTNELFTASTAFTPKDCIIKPQDGATGFYWSVKTSPGVKWSITAK